MRLGYADRTRSESERVVHPLGLVEKDGVWYLVADTANGMRTFRVNRVRSVVPTGDPVVRPDGFDLATTWSSVVATIEEKRASVRAVVRMPAWGPYALRGQFGPSTTVVAEHPDGRVDIEVGAPTEDYLAEHLAGWGDRLEVIEPPAVRARLAAIGRQLVARYDDGAS